MAQYLGKTLQRGAIWSRAIGVAIAVLCAGCAMPGPMGSATQPNVIVLRSTAGYFPNLAEFEDRLVDEGVCPTVAFPEAHGKIAERLIGGRNRGRLTGPVVLVGYGAGANAAVSLSERLNERGIEVEKLVLVEASDSKRIPQNVRTCFNIYKSQPWGEYVPVFAGQPVRPASPATEIVNYDVREYNDGRFDWDNYLTLAANPHVQDLMLEEVLVAFENQNSEEMAPLQERQFEEGEEGGGSHASLMQPGTPAHQ